MARIRTLHSAARLTLGLALAAGLAACTQTEQRNAAVGAAGGAIAGQLIGGDTESTVAGAAIGATAGVLVANAGRNDRGQCLYEDRNGRRYYADCP